MLSNNPNQKTLSVVSNVKLLIIFSLIIIFQIGFIQCYLPFSSWFSNTPIYSDDYSYHYANVLEQKNILNKYGHLWGYDPFRRAGTVTPTLINIDMKGWGLFIYMLFFLHEAISFKLYFIAGLLILPFLFYWSSKNFELSKSESLLCSILSTVYLHISLCADFLYWGTVSYIFSCYISIYICSLLYRFFTNKKPIDFFILIFLIPISISIHLYSSIHILAPFLICLVIFFNKIDLKYMVSIFLLMLSVLFLSSPFFVPILRFWDLQSSPSIWNPYTTQSFFEPIKIYFFQWIPFNNYKEIGFLKSPLVDIGILILSILGFLELGRRRERVKLYIFAGTGLFLFLLAYYGSFWGYTRRLTPLRFVIMLNLWLILSSSIGIIALYKNLLADKPKKMQVIYQAIGIYLLLIMLPSPYYSLYVKKQYRLKTEIPAPINELIQWIKTNTKLTGRILIEDSNWESNHQYYGTHIPFLLPIYTQREYVGAEYFSDPFKDSFLSFNRGHLFNHPLKKMDLEDLKSYFNLYNIRWIIYWSDDAKNFFKSYPQYIKDLKRIDKFNICEVQRKPTYFLKGEGEISAEINKIILKNLQPENGEIIISYHWMKLLKTKEKTKLRRVYLLDDPIGFISLLWPSTNVTIYNGY